MVAHCLLITWYFTIWDVGAVVTHPGLKTQVYVVCNSTKLVRVLLDRAPNVPLLAVSTESQLLLHSCRQRAIWHRVLGIASFRHTPTVTESCL